MKRIRSLADMLQAGMFSSIVGNPFSFHKRQVSFLVVKTAKCKRSINICFLFGETKEI